MARWHADRRLPNIAPFGGPSRPRLAASRGHLPRLRDEGCSSRDRRISERHHVYARSRRDASAHARRTFTRAPWRRERRRDVTRPIGRQCHDDIGRFDGHARCARLRGARADAPVRLHADRRPLLRHAPHTAASRPRLHQSRRSDQCASCDREREPRPPTLGNCGSHRAPRDRRRTR